MAELETKYNKITTREDTGALMPDIDIINEIVEGIITSSTILPLMTKLPNMTTGQESVPVLDALPEAYWVNGDTGLKGTTKAKWAKKVLYAEEIAVIVPISDNVLADSSYDIWGQIKPRLIEQAYKLIDDAIITGTNKPATWRAGLIPSAKTAGNTVTKTAVLYDDISDAMTAVETDGFDVTGILGGVALKGAFRKGFRDTTGQPLQASEVTELQRAFARNGAWDPTVTAIVGDFKQAVFSFRQDVKFDVFNTGVITDADGKIIYNLMQQDMSALRMTLRVAWELPNPINVLNDDNATRLPFAVIE